MTKAVTCQFNVFQNSKVRSAIHKEEIIFSIVDVVGVLTDSPNPRNYWNMHKANLAKEEGGELYTGIVQLKLQSSDGKYYLTECGNLDTIYEIMMDIRSKKARPFKKWLAKLGSDFTQGKLQYKPKKPKPQIPDSIKVPAIEKRKELTDVMKDCGKSGVQIIGMTNQIYRGALGADAKTIKLERGIHEDDNLREHLSPQERLIVMKAEDLASNLLMEEFKENGVVSSGAVGKTMREWCKTAREFFSSKPKLLT